MVYLGSCKVVQSLVTLSHPSFTLLPSSGTKGYIWKKLSQRGPGAKAQWPPQIYQLPMENVIQIYMEFQVNLNPLAVVSEPE